MAVLTLNPTKDSRMNEAAPTITYGSDTASPQGLGTPLQSRLLFEFDLLTLPANAIVATAVMRLNVTAHVTVSGARTAAIYRNRRTNWTETPASWDKFKSGGADSWTTAGCSHVTNDVDTSIAADVWTYPSALGYHTLTGFEVLVADARTNRGGIVAVVVHHTGAATESVTVNMRDSGSNKPELVITYSLPELASPMTTIMGDG